MTEITPVQVGKIGFLTGRILNAVDEVIGVEGGLSGTAVKIDGLRNLVI